MEHSVGAPRQQFHEAGEGVGFDFFHRYSFLSFDGLPGPPAAGAACKRFCGSKNLEIGQIDFGRFEF